MMNRNKLVFLSPKMDAFKQNNYWNTFFLPFVCIYE